MQPASIRLFARLLSSLLLAVVVCHLICHDTETSSDDSKALVSHVSLRPIPDPGPGTKGFEPWTNNEPIEGVVNCDGSICKTSVALQQTIPGGVKQPKGVMKDGPTLAFPTVLPPPPRGHLIEVGVEFQ